VNILEDIVYISLSVYRVNLAYIIVLVNIIPLTSDDYIDFQISKGGRLDEKVAMIKSVLV